MPDELQFVDLRASPNRDLLDAVHRDLFVPNFPDEDEQEDPDDWEPRLWGADPTLPEQHGYVAGTNLESPSERSLVGFAFVERYRESSTALLSYIAVARAGRGKNVARRLFELALGSAREAAEKEQRPLQAVLAEIHDPWAVESADDAIPPATRARIMERLGALRVPITYVQPPLSEDSSASGRLMLIAFPLEGEQSVDAGTVAGFLREYYAACEVEDLDADPDLAWMTQELEAFDGGVVPLVPLVSPSLKFSRFGIVLHFILRAPETVTELPPADSARPNPFASFEEDLLSYNYQPGRGHTGETDVRFFNRVVREDEDLVVEYSAPDALQYQSEGEVKALDLPPPDPQGERRRRFRIHASRTLFPVSRYVVCHLALSPEPGANVDEYDVVVLSKLWQGGENWDAIDAIRFNLGERRNLDVRALARHIFSTQEGAARAPETAWYPRAGTVQLITDDPEPGVDWPTIWHSVLVLVDDEENEEELVERIDRGDPLGRQLRALGGIVQGILDFKAIDAWELADVFKGPEVDSTALIGIHKGTLVCVMESDRSYEACADRIGVSPYLLFPQTALLHNEAVLDGVEEVADEVELTEEGKRDSIPRLSDCLKRMRRQLEWYLPDVFHYPSERDLFETGERTRGLSERRAALVAHADEIDARWKLAVEKRRSLSETVRNVLLAALSIVTTVHYVQGTFYRVLAICAYAVLMLLYVQSHPAWSWARVARLFRRGHG
jgi:GNAT superfamily N-acetyltransferase